jgi:hypothetical protein
MNNSYNDILLEKAVLIKAIIPGVAGGQRAQNFTFREESRLRFGRVYAMELLTLAEISSAPDGTQLANYDQLRRAFLSLSINGREDIDTMPVFLMHSMDTQNVFQLDAQQVVPSRRNIMKFKDGINLDFSKSQIKFATAPNNTTDIAICFMVYYQGGDK